MTKYQFRAAMLALLGGVLIWTGCRPEPQTPAEPHIAQDTVPIDGGCVRIAQSSDPEGLHPFNTTTGYANTIKECIYMYLGVYNSQTLEIEPTLTVAPPLVSADGLSFTYEMRPEARWDHGDPVTGEDYAFSVKCVLNPLADAAAQRSAYDFITDVVVDSTNPRRFTVFTREPFFMAELFLSSIEVISHAFYDSLHVMQRYTVAQLRNPDATLSAFSLKLNGDRYQHDPAFIYGSGPYRLQSWTTGDNLTLVKKENWWGDALRGKSYFFQAYPQTLIYKTIKDKATLPAAAKNGDIDVAQELLYDDYMAALQDSAGLIAQNFNLYSPAAYTCNFLGFNCKPNLKRKPLLTDVRVRQAIAHLVDIDNIVQNFYGGLCEPQWGPISPRKANEYDASLKRPAFDPAAASKLLDEAGWLDSDGDGVRDQMVRGKRLKLEIELLVSNTSDVGERIGRMLGDHASKIGMVITTNKLAFQALAPRLKAHDFDMYLGGFAANHLPTDLMQLWTTQNWVSGGSNYMGFGNAATDSLIAQIRQTPSAEARRPLYHRFQALWIAQLPAVTLVTPNARLWIHKRLRHANPTVLRPGFKPMEFWMPVAEQACN
jgi:peptide/nickel transport system substrate-binding protein